MNGGKEVVEKPANEKKGNLKKKTFAATVAVPQSESPESPVRKSPTPGKQQTTISSGDGVDLMAKSDCKACHSVNQKLVGPAFLDIANRYRKDRAALTKLTGKVIKGGAGNWGQVPMAPHPQLSQKDVSEMVAYILSLKK